MEREAGRDKGMSDDPKLYMIDGKEFIGKWDYQELKEQRDGLLEAAKNALTLLECFKVSTSIEDQLRKAIGRCGGCK